ncbi:HAMP domain-containing histidine kinase [Romboutsia sp. CE17]|uniref:sensor histidine kinase n=1 Tax=Romboutsia sp. CE17 TaxID=2724150 RepID=UPI001442B9CB|nr:HAMP domain-containing sensor histidine kinase [Romboutsia sp. CE17]QJA07847.1 HAMP domain-containing histidine kinase [Romboutsia sp. CE17]
MKNKKKHISINKKLILNFSLPMILFILIFSIIVNMSFKSEFDSYVFLKNKTIINEINNDIHKAYINDEWDMEILNNIGENLFKNGIILKVLDKDKNNIWNVSKRFKADHSDDYNYVKNNIKKVNKNLKKRIVKDESPIYDDKNEVIGYRVLMYDKNIYYLSDDITFLNEINNTLIALSVLLILNILIVSLFVARKISNPIKKVSYVTKSMKRGEYKNLDYTGEIEEVNDLILSINNLSESLKSQEHIRKRLITDLSHELKTPLTSMHGHLQAMIDGIWEATPIRLASIDKELMRITSLIDELKKLNKLENEPINKSKVNLRNIISSIVINFQAIALQKGVKISTKLDDVEIYADEDKLSQVITNIISNSIKYNKVDGNVYLSLYKNDNKVYIRVKDTGIGIKDEDIQYIFERFYRGDKSRSKSNEGLGVGLTISKMIIKEHGGEILVNTSLGEGSEFIIILPL